MTGAITTRKFDARHYVTEITTSMAFGKEDLSDSVIRIGKQWSVVKSSGPNGLTVWGKITDETPMLEILDHYLATK